VCWCGHWCCTASSSSSNRTMDHELCAVRRRRRRRCAVCYVIYLYLLPAAAAAAAAVCCIVYCIGCWLLAAICHLSSAPAPAICRHSKKAIGCWVLLIGAVGCWLLAALAAVGCVESAHTSSPSPRAPSTLFRSTREVPPPEARCASKRTGVGKGGGGGGGLKMVGRKIF
jgi:hypothetical protein